jgi:hypothetical protein
LALALTLLGVIADLPLGPPVPTSAINGGSRVLPLLGSPVESFGLQTNAADVIPLSSNFAPLAFNGNDPMDCDDDDSDDDEQSGAKADCRDHPRPYHLGASRDGDLGAVLHVALVRERLHAARNFHTSARFCAQTPPTGPPGALQTRLSREIAPS